MRAAAAVFEGLAGACSSTAMITMMHFAGTWIERGSAVDARWSGAVRARGPHASQPVLED